ncbi:hypothetical protein CGCA056_v009555 [Colletotrichum aenigma]|uniref:uncharacterized protein n=1 Tax=Colletotrichum aenigma TaxID=1215731 RepID=UPI00187269C7|nr:uncharacterized protein CGCA056_v009555 [Colletotrichum aenigma]KAF5519440.1 hypothetical protein CGCA056_v009555 [Colletotrichum aenigma]
MRLSASVLFAAMIGSSMAQTYVGNCAVDTASWSLEADQRACCPGKVSQYAQNWECCIPQSAYTSYRSCCLGRGKVASLGGTQCS